MIHPLIFSIAVGKRVTEGTNGFRAFRAPLLRDPRIDPPYELGYSKMRPVVDWWSILRPVIYLGLGLKK